MLENVHGLRAVRFHRPRVRHLVHSAHGAVRRARQARLAKGAGRLCRLPVRALFWIQPPNQEATRSLDRERVPLWTFGDVRIALILGVVLKLTSADEREGAAR